MKIKLKGSNVDNVKFIFTKTSVAEVDFLFYQAHLILCPAK